MKLRADTAVFACSQRFIKLKIIFFSHFESVIKTWQCIAVKLLMLFFPSFHSFKRKSWRFVWDNRRAIRLRILIALQVEMHKLICTFRRSRNRRFKLYQWNWKHQKCEPHIEYLLINTNMIIYRTRWNFSALQ